VIIHREVFDEVGLFDESLPVCEDYDLWLRIGCRYAIGLIEEPLIIKRGGHTHQLSNSMPGLDRYRIQALVNLLKYERLSPSQHHLVLQALNQKCLIYGEGCRKRGKVEEAELFLGLPSLCASLFSFSSPED
jgi:GT2 family glycosyltransferase